MLALRAGGLGAADIARTTGIPRSTVRDWLAPRLARVEEAVTAMCESCGHAPHRFEALPESYVYLLGLYLGDGCISAHPRDVYRLRISLDLRYPAIIDEAEAAIRALAPLNRTYRQRRRSSYRRREECTFVELSAYSRTWPCLFPQHGPGRKHLRRIVLTEWQERRVAAAPFLLLRGLIHSDGCRFRSTGRNWAHPRYSFSNLSDDIRAIFCHACELAGVHWTASGAKTIYVSRKADVALLDEWIGPKA